MAVVKLERALPAKKPPARVCMVVSAGAQEQTLEVIDVEDLPLAYLPGDAFGVRVRVVGDVG